MLHFFLMPTLKQQQEKKDETSNNNKGHKNQVAAATNHTHTHLKSTISLTYLSHVIDLVPFEEYVCRIVSAVAFAVVSCHNKKIS